MFGGGGGSTKTSFNAGSIPQSLYGLGGDINYFRQHDLEPLLSAPLSIANWGLAASGVPVQQGATPGGFIKPLVYGGSATGTGTETSLTPDQLATGSIPSNPWAGKTAGSYGDPTAWYNWINSNVGKYVYINGNPVQVKADQGTMRQISEAQANGTLSTQGTDIQQAKSIWNQVENSSNTLLTQGQSELSKGITDLNNVPGYEQILSAGNPFFQQAQTMFNTAAPLVEGKLTPEQQAYVTQATQSEKAGLIQQLENEGLGSSTMLQEKLGAAEQAGAATAGSLIQGNIQLGEGEQQLAESEQGVGVNEQQVANQAAQTQASVAESEASLGLNMQTTANNYLMAISTANTQLQAQLFTEAMQGYGVFGQLLNSQLQTFGYQLSGEQIKVGASTSANQIAAQATAAQNQADASSFSTLLGGLGSILGKRGGGGIGGLLGGAGSLLGGSIGAGGAAAGGAVGAAGGAAGIGSAVGSALTALSAAFCAIGREIFGVDNPEWLLFRDIMLFRAPKWFRRFYIRHAPAISLYLRNRVILKAFVRTILRVIIPCLE